MGADETNLTAGATVRFTTLGGGTLVEGDTNEDFMVDMIDLSNMVDWFGYNEETEGWDDWYVYFDFNGNGRIDVYDIAYVARLIGTSSRAALEALIARAESLNEADYTAESWAGLPGALEAAKKVAADPQAEARQIAQAIKGLKDAMDALEKLSQPADRAALEALVAQAKALNEAYYTPDSWLPLQDALAAAEGVLPQADPEQAEIQAAYDGLLAAMQGLVLKADSLLELLRLFVESFEKLEESAFTPESWAPFKEVLTAARAMVDAGNAPDDEVLAMLDALLDAYEGLVLDKAKALRELMAQAEKLLEDPSGYWSGSVKKLQAALDAAKELLKTPMEELEQEEIDAAATALMDAISTLFEKGDVTPLATLVQYAQLLDGGLYTAASFGPFAAALATAAQKAAENDMLPEEVTALYNSLRAAIGGLVPRANKTGLESAIAVAQAIVDNKGDYVEATIAGLEEALAATKALYAKDEATQAEVEAAASDLMARAMAARKPANKRGLSLALDYSEAAPEGAQGAALEEARAVLEDPQATQQVVDAAKAAVDEAIG